MTDQTSNLHNVYVTQPSLPPLEDFQGYLEQLWERKVLTNQGPLHSSFEQQLADHLGVRHVSLFSNGTSALMVALKVLDIEGEVITTPFSFVATTHAVWWNRLKPVFADVDPVYGNLDPDKIEQAITPDTAAILPVHIYGNPCQVDRIQEVASRHGLKVIYDACHTFNVRIGGDSVLNFGDLSVLSFHATKVFNTFEGGAIVSHDAAMKEKIDRMKNFGFADEVTIVSPGINAKMSEVQAAMGLLQLRHVDSYIERRMDHVRHYRENLSGISGLRFLRDMPDVDHCYTYFPVFFEESNAFPPRDLIYEGMRKKRIFGRRYFFPLISQIPAYRELDSAKPGRMPRAEKLSREVICLPLFPHLSRVEADRVIDALREICSA